MHDENDFVTLTYRPEDLPKGGTLVKDHLQKFIKRARKRYGVGLKYYAVGEYGDKLGRPHYHIALMGKMFDRTEIVRAHKDPTRIVYRSDELDRPRPGHEEQPLWPYGFSSCGTLNEKTASYISSYITKKVVGDQAAEYYQGKTPEFALMSRGGRSGRGLAATWFDQYYTDVYPKDYIHVGNRTVRPPKYYDHLYDQIDPDRLKLIKASRAEYVQTQQESLLRMHQKEQNAKINERQKNARKKQGEEVWNLICMQFSIGNQIATTPRLQPPTMEQQSVT